MINQGTSARLAITVGALLLAGCGGGGDVNISADNNSVTNDNSVTNGGGGGSSNPCASYTDPSNNAFVQGSFDGTNCVYDSAFVGENNPLTVDLTIPFVNGAHVFQDTLAVGVNVDGTDPSILAPAGGTGPTLTIAAGSTLAWTDPADYLLVNRGSQIIAEGTELAPITFTGFTDAVSGTAGPEDVQLWGGIVINGNGITNTCTDVQRSANTCNILSEGKPSNYGGNDNAESSGTLRYVVVKHTGFEVAPGDELNGISFNAVGAGTLVENLEVYSTFDDGVEFFGGAVEVTNLVALFVRDDSIDYADGWVGSVTNALVIHQATDGNRCIEGDNNGDQFDLAPITSPVISNMTCIISGNDGGTHGDSEGILLRRGVQSQIVDSIIIDTYARTVLSLDGNECLEMDDGPTRARAAAGASTLQSSIIACQTPTQDDLENGDTIEQWVLNSGATAYPGNTGNRIITASNSANLVILDGFYTAPAFADDTGTPFTVAAVGDPTPIGAVSAADDWTANWTFGLDALWF